MRNLEEKAVVANKKQRSLWQEAWRRFRKNRMAMAGLVFLSILVVIAVVTLVIDLVTQNEIYNNYVINQDLVSRLQGPSLQHPLGQDEFGRDMLLRMLWGTRYSLFMGSLAIIFSLCVGGVLGALSGFYGKLTDSIIMRIMDVLLAIPSMLLATAIVAALGTSLVNVLIAIGISYIPTFARTVRASVLTVKDQDYIEAARSIGCNDGEIIFKYIIPNAMAPIIVQATLGLAGAILSIAGLSFLGLGAKPPTAEWGSMMSEGRSMLQTYPWTVLTPGIAIFISVVLFNLLGDTIRDYVDPGNGSRQG